MRTLKLFVKAIKPRTFDEQRGGNLVLEADGSTLSTTLIVYCEKTLSIIYSTCELLSLILSDLLFLFIFILMS